ncbi:(Fe-S)-binding protein [Candidatus Woesearchaeota archaeon]|nr:(Fe-S)-binding protein [Candidatus Woesearchaeota archaeon]
MGLISTVKTLFVGKTLFYPGCVTKYKLKEIKNNYLDILNELGYKVVTLEDELCCGLPALNMGYNEDFERLRHENIKLFEKHHIKNIITNCPACASMFKENYNIPTQHVTEVIPEQDITEDRGEVSYHDPCHLARKCNSTEQPRKLIKSLGFKIKDNLNQGKETSCCGTGHIDFDKPLCKQIAEKRLKDFSTRRIITTCPLCYKHLKDGVEENEIIELSEVIMK